MGGSVIAVEAVMGALLHQRLKGKNSHVQVALSEAAAYLGLPHSWGMTTPGGAIGGAHAGYRIYACKDGRVAVAALEPHFALALCTAVGIENVDRHTMLAMQTHETIAAFLGGLTRRKLDALSVKYDIPLFTLAK